MVAEDSEPAGVHWGDEKRGLRVVLELLSFWNFLGILKFDPLFGREKIGLRSFFWEREAMV